MIEANIKKVSFEQSIYYTFIDIPKNILEISESITLKEYEIHINNYSSLEEKDKEKGKKIVNFLSENVLAIIKKNNYNKFEVTKWWVQKYHRNHFHDLHIHGTENDCFSLILYLDCTDKSSCINFYQPLHPYVDIEPISFKPQKGLMIVFPSFMPHAVLPNDDLKRSIFSLNMKCYR